MNPQRQWPKKPIKWIIARTLYVSIPFTWNLPRLLEEFQQQSLFWDKVVVGGPAIKILPSFFSELAWVETWDDYPDGNVLSKIHPLATRTSYGCTRSCPFCAVNFIEGEFRELNDWPDLPVVIDSNLLATTISHFDRVMDRLEKHDFCDFASGLDARCLTKYHAERLSRLKKPMIRLALDSMDYAKEWQNAFDKLMVAKIAKSNIRTYALIGFDSDPIEAWKRCEWVEDHGIFVLPMWYHELDQLKFNTITEKQKELGWDNKERKRIMQWYYWHRGSNPLK